MPADAQPDAGAPAAAAEDMVQITLPKAMLTALRQIVDEADDKAGSDIAAQNAAVQGEDMGGLEGFADELNRK